MVLFYLIICIAFLQTNAYLIVNLIINAIKLLDGSGKNKQAIEKQISELTSALSDIEMTEEWAKYAKLNRKIMAEKSALEKLNAAQLSRLLKIRGFTTVIIKGILGFAIFIVAWWYRNVVVTRISSESIFPVSSYICWSKEDPDGITAPAWIILSFAGARAVSTFY